MNASSMADLLPLASLDPAGLAVLEDGTYVRWLGCTPVNPLALDSDDAEELSRTLTQVAMRLAAGESIALLVDAEPIAVDAVAAGERARSDAARDAALAGGHSELALALDRLGAAAEESIRQESAAVNALSVRYAVACPWWPRAHRRRRSRTTMLRIDSDEHERNERDSLKRALGIASDLEAAGVAAQLIEGHAVADLLWRRTAPGLADAGVPCPVTVHPELLHNPRDSASSDEALMLTRSLKAALCPLDLEEPDRRSLHVGSQDLHVRYLGSLPEQTWPGWLLHAMQSPLPFALTVHVHALDRHAERLHHRRRYRRIYGNNRGTEMRGRPLDPDQQQQEDEAAELTQELAASAGTGIYRLSAYLALRAPRGNDEELYETADALTRELVSVNDAHLHDGRWAQLPLWQSTLPTGVDVAKRTRKYVTANVGDTLPLVGTGCGSPAGIPLGFSGVERTLERIDLYDGRHPNHMLLVNGRSGSGKTMAVNVMLSRAIAQGATGAIIERGGHYGFLASLVPGAHELRLGSDAHAVCPWDAADPADVGPEKVDFLIALHAMLVGSWRGDDEHGLTALEQNLLGRAIADVYRRCAATREPPRETVLQEILYSTAHVHAEAGATQMADALRDLAARLHNFVGDGPYAYLCDRTTTVPHGSPLIVFDTQSVPEAFSGAALFVVVEHLVERIRLLRSAHLNASEDGHAWRGRSFLVIDEAWKLVRRRATGVWVNELARRSRHLALALIAVSQQLKDFDNEHGRALIDNAAMKLFLRQEKRELAYVREALGLTATEIDAISQLQTVRRDYSTAYFVNGDRGRGTVTLRVAALEYWIATHDPDRDEPLRQRALRAADGDPWKALELLADATLDESGSR